MLSYPFTSQVTYDDYGQPLYDRAVDSEFLRKVFLQYFSDGVFYKPTNALQVVVDTGMQVAVEPGACHIRGAMGIEESRRTLVVQASEGQDRIDTVVARLDLSTAVRSIDLYIVKGIAAVSPQAPALTRDATVWELGLANIFVAKNTQTISQQRITDTRLDTARCGIVVQTIGDVDTSPYFAQLTAAIASHQAEAEGQIQILKDAIAAVEGDTAWMMQDVYDPQRKRRDVFAYPAHIYKATFLTSAWESEGEGPYTQTVQVYPVDGGPEITSASIMTSQMSIKSAVQGSEQYDRQKAAALIDRGAKTFGEGTLTCTLDGDVPNSDAEVYFSARVDPEGKAEPLGLSSVHAIPSPEVVVESKKFTATESTYYQTWQFGVVKDGYAPVSVGAYASAAALQIYRCSLLTPYTAAVAISRFDSGSIKGSEVTVYIVYLKIK